MIRTVLSVVLIIVCVALIGLILAQESKQRGLSALTGQTDDTTYWGKNKARSRESRMRKITAVGIAVIFVLSALLDTNLF